MQIKVLNSLKDKALIKSTLESGKAIAIPSDTVYGLAALFDNTQGLEQIYKIKERPSFNPLIVHISKLSQLSKLTEETPGPLTSKVISSFWPGGLSILFQKSKNVPDLCTSGSKYVAVRCPHNKDFRNVIEAAGKPLAAPSANKYQSISPTCVDDVVLELNNTELEYVVSGEISSAGIESTLIKINEKPETIEIYRYGAISSEELQSKLGADVIIKKAERNIPTPGQDKKHYSPKRPFAYFNSESELAKACLKTPEAEILFVCKSDETTALSSIKHPRHYLSDQNSMSQAASKLFAKLRKLSSTNSNSPIFSLKTAESGLGIAINDRLQRAQNITL